MCVVIFGALAALRCSQAFSLPRILCLGEGEGVAGGTCSRCDMLGVSGRSPEIGACASLQLGFRS